MALTKESDLPESIKAFWVKAQGAVDLRNYRYAITLLQDVLKEEPHFLPARRLLRKAEIADSKGGKKLFGIGGFGNKGAGLVKKDPKAAMEEAEKGLVNDPYNVSANLVLRDAALALDDKATAQFALETAAEGNPKETKVLHLLGEFYDKYDSPEKAVEVYNRIQRIDPSDLTAVKAAKDAAARASMSRGNWEREGDFRDKLKSSEESEDLEQGSRAVMSEEVINSRLEDFYAKAEEDPENQNWPREIAQLLERKEEWPTALQWWEYLDHMTGSSDPGITRRISELRARVAETEIREKKQALEQSDLDEESKQQLKQEIASLEEQLAEHKLQTAQKRIDKNPTDLNLRLEYGEMLVNAGHYSDAIPQLQKAQNSPHARVRAMSLLGQCYREKKMYPLAIQTLEKAREMIPTMDATKKEITYELAQIYEANDERKKALELFTEIYAEDYNYRDVAERVESSYDS